MAETRSSGVSTTTLNLPDGLSFWEPSEGLNTIDVVPWPAGKGNPYAKPGILHWERTFWAYRGIGVDEKSYVCPSKTFQTADPIQEFIREKARDRSADADYLKQLEPKERQLFLIYDHKATEKGVQLWEFSFHNFGKKLLSRIKASPLERGWDEFYFPDGGGFTLEVSFEKQSRGGYKFLEALAVDFIARRHGLPDEIVNHGYVPDDFLVNTPYDELKRIFLGLPAQENDAGAGDDAPAADTRTTARRTNEAKPAQSRDAEPATDKIDHFAAGADAFRRGRKRDANPWKRGTDQYLEWAEGFLDAAEKAADGGRADPTPQPPSYAKGDVVMYRTKRHEVMRVLGDGTLTLMDPNDEIVKGVASRDVSGWDEVPSNGGGKQPEPVAEKKTGKTTKTKQSDEKAPAGDESAWDDEWAN